MVTWCRDPGRADGLLFEFILQILRRGDVVFEEKIDRGD